METCKLDFCSSSGQTEEEEEEHKLCLILSNVTSFQKKKVLIHVIEQLFDSHTELHNVHVAKKPSHRLHYM